MRVSRFSPSRRPVRGRRLLTAFVVAVGALASLPDARAEDVGCGPFEASGAPGVSACREPGLSSSGPEGFTRLPAPPDDAGAVAIPGEALLALPKGPGGAIPSDFELGPGARVAESFFSPVLCATVARIVGPGGSGPATLVSRMPDGAIAVAHHVYRTAGASVRLLGAPAPGRGPDPYRSLQYALDELGVARGASLGAGGGATVAVLDSAPDVNHPDLDGVRIHALDGSALEPAPHGTLVTGVIHALAGNAFGIAGVAPASQAVAVPICTPSGASASDTCRLYDALRGMDAVWDVGAGVANLSIVGPPNELLERAVTRLDELGVLLVAAAGNEGTDAPRYPAAYPAVIGVGAVDRLGQPFERGNRGPSAELEAPGVEILSTYPGGSFAFVDGTSLAAAQVSGVLAILLGAGIEPLEARAAIFGAARARPERPGTARLGTVCDAAARAGRPCVAP